MQREAKLPWRGGFFLGGPRGDSESPPLGPSKPPVTPLKRAAQRGPAGPLAATGFPRRRTDLIKVGNSSLNEPSYAGLGGSPAGSGQRPAVSRGLWGARGDLRGEIGIPPSPLATSFPLSKGIIRGDSVLPLIPPQKIIPFPAKGSGPFEPLPFLYFSISLTVPSGRRKVALSSYSPLSTGAGRSSSAPFSPALAPRA